MVVHGGWKIDDNDIVVNNKKCLGCNWFIVIFEIIEKLKNNDNFVNISKHKKAGFRELLRRLRVQGAVFGLGPLPHGPNGLEGLGPSESQVLCLAHASR